MDDVETLRRERDAALAEVARLRAERDGLGEALASQVAENNRWAEKVAELEEALGDLAEERDG